MAGDKLQQLITAKHNKKINTFKVTVSLLCISFLFACSSLKRIIPLKELTPEQLEPRITFVDNQQVEVNSSQINSVDAEQVIESYLRLLNRGDPEVRKEALHHLADLSMRLSEAKLAVEGSSQSDLSVALKRASFSQAIEYYQILLNEFPDYQHKDQVNYQLARAYSLNADPESSLLVLDKIANSRIQSNTYVETQFRRGESYFVRKKYQIAEQAYSQVIIKGVDSEFYDKALYKRGWSLFKQSLYLDAQNDFFKLYQRIISQQSVIKNQKGLENQNVFINDLLLDTQRVISLTFYNMQGAESVQQYFSHMGHKDYEDKIYDSLAKLYISQERYQDAANTYFAFIEKNTFSLSAPEFHTQAIEIYRQGGFPSLILPAKEMFVVNYGRQSSFWHYYQANEFNLDAEPKVITQLKPYLKNHLNDISTFYHAQAQTSKKQNDYLIAAKWYQEILVTFNEPVVDSKFRFLLAETLSEGGQLKRAATEYEIVAYKNELSQYSRDAGYRALVVYQKRPYPENASHSEKLLPSIQSGLRFIQAFVSDPESFIILARVAEQQLSINDIQGAIDSSHKQLLLKLSDNKKQANRARVIIANGLFDLKKYAEAEVAISDLLKLGRLSQSQRKEFKQRRVESIYQLADAAKRKNNSQQAIDLFLKVMRLEPDSRVAVNAHFDAATLLLQLKQWGRAAKLLESFRIRHPSNKLTQTIAEKLAFVYENQKSWNKAAAEYKILSVNQSDPELAREGYWHIAELYLKAKNNAQAIKALKHYVWSYPQPYLLAQEARYHLVQLYDETKDQPKTYFWRKKIVTFYSKNMTSNNARTAFLAAESKYLISQELFDQYKKIKLKLPLAGTLKRKRYAMKKALKAYNAIVKYNVAAYTTASTHKVARIYQILSDDLISSQRPKGMDEDELEEYGYLLEDQALPFEDKAIDFFEINARRTANNIYDKSVKASINALKKLKPAQYDKNEKLVGLANVDF